MAKTEWLALSYTVPTSPSKVRVYVWRRLRSIGAQQLRPGLAVLPNSGEYLDAFIGLAERIKELSGEATVIEMDFTDEAESLEMKRRFSTEGERQLRETLRECGDILDRLGKTADGRARAQLERELRRRIERMQSLSPMQQQAADIERTASELLDTLKALPGELSAMLKVKK